MQMLDSVCNAILFTIQGHKVCMFFYIICRIAHRNTDPCIFQHRNIIAAISECHAFFSLDAPSFQGCPDAFGLSAFLATSPEAMTAVKLAGAAYLLWLGIRAISSRAPGCGTLDAERSSASAFDAFRSGVIADVLNPKAALFVLSFFPQFLTQQAVGSPAAFITLGVLYTLISLAWYIPLALCVSSAGSRLLAKPAFNRWSGKATGLVFVLLGLQVAAG